MSGSLREQVSLYIHVPFCARKCEYCAFYSEPTTSGLSDRYTAALIRELELTSAGHHDTPHTVFFGGGTPSLLSLSQWERIFGAMQRFGFLGANEWTVECNPATVSLDKARLLRSHGVNRISMGVQSLDSDLLNRLGRVHSRDMVFRSFDTLRQAGFDNINIDLMFAIPGQTMAIWRDTLNEALAMGSEHLSCYEVIYEEDTPLFRQLRAGEFDVDEDLACAMYERLLERAASAGLEQYEVANFARRGTAPHEGLPRFACRHNINYWRGGQFDGLGPSACGYRNGVRTRNWADTIRYSEQLERGVRPVESREALPPLARAGEIAAFGLRMNSGWSFDEFQRRTGYDLRQDWSAEMDELVGRGWGWRGMGGFRLTTPGLRFADSAAECFLKP